MVARMVFSGLVSVGRKSKAKTEGGGRRHRIIFEVPVSGGGTREEYLRGQYSGVGALIRNLPSKWDKRYSSAVTQKHDFVTRKVSVVRGPGKQESLRLPVHENAIAKWRKRHTDKKARISRNPSHRQTRGEDVPFSELDAAEFAQKKRNLFRKTFGHS